jgi:hypothetical protein
MKPTAIKMTSFAGDPTAASASVIAACKSADEQLWLLRKVRFDADGIDSQPSYPRVSEFAEQLLDRRPVFCRPDNGSAQRILSCREWCIETWTELVSAVDRLRNAAKKEDVNIVSLTQPE